MTRAKIRAALRQHGPMTSKQIAMELGATLNCICRIVSRARAEQHGSSILYVARRVGSISVWAAGPGEDAEGGKTATEVLEYLSGHKPATAAIIASSIGRRIDTVRAAIRALRSKPGRLHIAAWKLRRGTLGGREAPMYAAGPGKDVARPDFSDSARQGNLRRLERNRVQSQLNGKRPGTRGPGRKTLTNANANPFAGLAP